MDITHTFLPPAVLSAPTRLVNGRIGMPLLQYSQPDNCPNEEQFMSWNAMISFKIANVNWGLLQNTVAMHSSLLGTWQYTQDPTFHTVSFYKNTDKITGDPQQRATVNSLCPFWSYVTEKNKELHRLGVSVSKDSESWELHNGLREVMVLVT